MSNQTLEIKTGIQIQKPPHEVFQAIVDPEKMKNYFISESTGRIEEGKELVWKFPEFEMKIPVRVEKIEKDQYISYHWDDNGHEQLVEITLLAKGDNDTHVTVTEKSRDNDEAGIKWLKGNTEGWANFLACLKAWLEYGINLRKGAFDFAKPTT
ncbi:MAG: SRPBCC domain-containing protein [Bacteroidota bacterium]